MNTERRRCRAEWKQRAFDSICAKRKLCHAPSGPTVFCRPQTARTHDAPLTHLLTRPWLCRACPTKRLNEQFKRASDNGDTLISPRPPWFLFKESKQKEQSVAVSASRELQFRAENHPWILLSYENAQPMHVHSSTQACVKVSTNVLSVMLLSSNCCAWWLRTWRCWCCCWWWK